VIQAFQVVLYGSATTVRLEEIKNLKLNELIIAVSKAGESFAPAEVIVASFPTNFILPLLSFHPISIISRGPAQATYR